MLLTNLKNVPFCSILILELWVRHCEALLLQINFVIPSLEEPMYLPSHCERTSAALQLGSVLPSRRGTWSLLLCSSPFFLGASCPVISFTLPDSSCASCFLPSFLAPPPPVLYPGRSDFFSSHTTFCCCSFYPKFGVSCQILMKLRAHNLKSHPWAHTQGSGMKLTATSE